MTKFFLLVTDETDTVLDDVAYDWNQDLLEEWAGQRKTESNLVEVVDAESGAIVYSV